MAVLTRRRVTPPAWRLLGAAAAVVAAAVAACRSSPPAPVPPVPEPAEAPVTRSEPAGRVVPLPGRPEGLAFDPVTAKLVAGVDGGVVVLDPGGGSAQLVGLGARPRHVGLAEGGGAVLVPLEPADELVVVGLPGGEVRQRVRVGRQPHDAAGAAGKIFVSDESADTVSVIEGSAVRATLPAPTQPGGVATDGESVVVIGVRGRRLGVLDASAVTERGRLDAGVGPTHVVAHQSFAYVTDTQGDAILVYRLGARPERAGRTAAPGAPYGVALDASRSRLWVTLTETNELLEFRIDGDRLRRGARYPTVRQPNSVAVDPRTGTVYVAGAADGQLQIVTPEG